MKQLKRTELNWGKQPKVLLVFDLIHQSFLDSIVFDQIIDEIMIHVSFRFRFMIMVLIFFLVVVNRNIMSVRAASCRKLLKQLFFHIRKHGRGSVRKDMDGNYNIQDKFPRMLDLKSSLSRIYCSPDKCPGSLNIQNLDCSLYIAVLGYFQVPERYISSQRIKSILYSMLDRSPTHKLDQQTITRRIELVTSIHWIAGSTEWSVESWESRE